MAPYSALRSEERKAGSQVAQALRALGVSGPHWLTVDVATPPPPQVHGHFCSSPLLFLPFLVQLAYQMQQGSPGAPLTAPLPGLCD